MFLIMVFKIYGQIILWMDEPGRNASPKAYELLKEHDMSCRIINMKDTKDPDEFINSYGVSDMVAAMKRSVA